MTKAQNEGLQWLSALPRFGIRPGLVRTERVLEKLGHPEKRLAFLHVAGTNGKGSVCSYLHQLFSVHHRMGLFTSPAYDGFRARFRIGNDVIPPDEFAELATTVHHASTLANPSDPITEFEALTVMAILYFAEHQVDGVVWETGLGGRYDSTNVVTPITTTLVNVGMDHTEILGNTYRAIASDKAGIAKPGIPMVTATIDSALWEVRRQAESVGAKVFVHGLDFGIVRSFVSSDSQRVHYRGIGRDVFDLHLRMLGAHQCLNLGVALATMETAVMQGAYAPLTDSEIRRAVERTVWPGRFECRDVDGIRIVLDGAHNADGARAFATALREYCDKNRMNHRCTLIIGVLADKEINTMLHFLLPLAGRVVTITPPSARALEAEDLAERIRQFDPQLRVTSVASADEAVSMTLKENQGEVICGCGSLYTVDQIRHTLHTLTGIPTGPTG